MRKSLLMAATAMSAMSVPAMAQDQDDGSFDDNVIIVTAQRQAQSLQEVPIAVSAFDSKALDAQQIENASDLQLTLPNVQFSKGNFNRRQLHDPGHRRSVCRGLMRFSDSNPSQ